MYFVFSARYCRCTNLNRKSSTEVGGIREYCPKVFLLWALLRFVSTLFRDFVSRWGTILRRRLLKKGGGSVYIPYLIVSEVPVRVYSLFVYVGLFQSL